MYNHIEKYPESIRPTMNRIEDEFAIQVQSKLKPILKRLKNYVAQKIQVHKSLAMDLAKIIKVEDFEIKIALIIEPLKKQIIKYYTLQIFKDLKTTTADLNLDFNKKPQYTNYIGQRTEWLANELYETTIQQAKTIILKGLDEGLSYDDIAQKLTVGLGYLDESRAKKIARTEVNAAFNEGSREYLQQLDIKKYKIKLANGACQLCQARAKKTYNITTKDILPIHPNCRCIVDPVIPVSWLV